MIEQARRPKAADIPDERILSVVRSVKRGHASTRWDIAAAFPDMPFKVVSAKLNAMVRRGLLEGCSGCHDCRGDFSIKEAQG